MAEILLQMTMRSEKSERSRKIRWPATSFSGILDMLWMNNLDDLESLSQSVGLRAYGQHDPLVEYRQEAHRLFQKLLDELQLMDLRQYFQIG